MATGRTDRLVELTQVEEARPASSEAVVAQQVISLNRGESNALRRSAAGVVHGWDVAGVVTQAAAEGALLCNVSSSPAPPEEWDASQSSWRSEAGRT